MPAPVLSPAARPTPYGALYYGSTSPAIDEAREILAEQGIPLDLMRIRAFPFQYEVMDFIAGHERVFVIEQNRDAQMRTLLINEGELNPKLLQPVLSYDGTPITSRFIVDAIAEATGHRHAIPAVEEIP